jgi:short-subunit dehydrogenase
MKIVLLGASRGLGAATQKIYESRGREVIAFSRTSKNPLDFSKTESASLSISQVQKECPTHLIFFAGGGPFGDFAKKEFKDHEWAFRLCFLFPAQLLHQILKSPQDWPALKQICFIGSAVADSKADPGAASYAAAKHALKGLVTSVQREPHGSLDIRLFSPSYMDTHLLPKNAWPRQEGGRVHSPEKMAEFLVSWLESSQSANQHQVFE